MRKDIKVLFMGTPEFAKTSFEKLYESGYNIIGCYTNPDKPAGRGMKMKFSPVKEYAILKNIPVFQPVKVRSNEEVINEIKELNPDVIAVVAYGKILPKEILDIPRFGCVNVHSSLLPKYRGSAPMQWAIINGEEKTGVTTMLMDIGMDTGDMLLKEEIAIEDSDNLETIHDKLMVIGGDLLVETLDKLVDGTIVKEKQGSEFSLAPMINRETTHIDFNKEARQIFNFVRGLSPYPGTFMKREDGKIYKVFEIEYQEIAINGKNGEVIEVAKDTLKIKCNDGYIKIKTIQPENSKRMDIQAFLQGNKINLGDLFV